MDLPFLRGQDDILQYLIPLELVSVRDNQQRIQHELSDCLTS